ncbi:hypothetical protein [Mastigocoleus sp. MO_188.B34]|uniref:hypothetical protein n=1 Tax=Mastigocoleus sp. MO_188.B34 TaxID=3036635 RepID=UPI002617B2E9|nr:hypothetical protein [Mastigocoleus sp. MO_188.B34]MDJ0698023.1 hypothetical protein [Mastigocoleus sp. MO_188.B34]
MNKILAEIKIDNVSTPFIHISKSSEVYRRKEGYENQVPNLLMGPQGFIWYPDFIGFDMLSDAESYWVKIAVSETLQIDPIIAAAKDSFEASAIVLPFQVINGERVYLFGDDDAVIFSFTLPVGHYQLLFQNRNFTTEEIENSPHFKHRDLDSDDCDRIPELCILTFIPTNTAIKPEILVYKGSLETTEPPEPLILCDR